MANELTIYQSVIDDEKALFPLAWKVHTMPQAVRWY